MTSIPVAILVRVSAQKQETDRQITELQTVATVKRWEVVEVVGETVSGSSQKRPGLNRIIELAEAGHIQKVLVHEVSRVARKNSIAHLFLERLDELGVSLYWHSQGIETRLSNGKRNPAAGIMFSLLSEMARSERETLVERTKSGLEAARRSGVTLGRPVGTTTSTKELLAKHADVAKLLRTGKHSIRQVATLSGKSKGTVEAVKKVMSKQC
jgi:DNA invertase Pin-like site-specific DNA recombinase